MRTRVARLDSSLGSPSATPTRRKGAAPTRSSSFPQFPTPAQPLDHADYDVLAHVNNAAYWAALEELLGAQPLLDEGPAFGVVEHRQPLAPGANVELAADVPDERGAFGWWLLDGDEGAAAGWFSRGVVAFSGAEAHNSG